MYDAIIVDLGFVLRNYNLDYSSDLLPFRPNDLISFRELKQKSNYLFLIAEYSIGLDENLAIDEIKRYQEQIIAQVHATNGKIDDIYYNLARPIDIESNYTIKLLDVIFNEYKHIDPEQSIYLGHLDQKFIPYAQDKIVVNTKANNLGFLKDLSFNAIAVRL